MYIGVGTLFCVTLPAEIRYGMGVRMWAPSMPLPSEPSTRLSRVAPQEACFCTSTSGMPYFAKIPFSLPTKSGAASVSAMKPSITLVTSGPVPSACAPPGKFALSAPRSAAVPALAWRKFRRLTPRRLEVPCSNLVVIGRRPFGVSNGSQVARGVAPARRFSVVRQKAAALGARLRSQDSGIAVGPSLDLVAADARL